MTEYYQCFVCNSPTINKPKSNQPPICDLHYVVHMSPGPVEGIVQDKYDAKFVYKACVPRIEEDCFESHLNLAGACDKCKNHVHKEKEPNGVPEDK